MFYRSITTLLLCISNPAVLAKSPTVCVCPYLFVFVSFKEGSYRLEALVSHWKPHLSITVLSTDFPFNKAGLPSDLRRHMRVWVSQSRGLVNTDTCCLIDWFDYSHLSLILPHLSVCERAQNTRHSFVKNCNVRVRSVYRWPRMRTMRLNHIIIYSKLIGGRAQIAERTYFSFA